MYLIEEQSVCKILYVNIKPIVSELMKLNKLKKNVKLVKGEP